MQARRNPFLLATLLCAVPLLALLAPLWFHRSGTPEVGPYDRSYAILLAVLTGGAVMVSLGIGLLARRAGSPRPAFALVTMVVASALALGLVEFGLRCFANDEFAMYRGWGHRKAALFGYEAAANHSWSTPGDAWVDPRAAGIRYSTDAEGMRTHVSDPNWRTSDKPRVFALGGSSVFGFGLPDDGTWPHRLEAKLRDGGTDVQVINAGTNGHNSLQCLLRFYLKVLPHRPRLLIYYESNNDVADYACAPTDLWIEEPVLFSEGLTSYLAKTKAGKSWYARTLLGYRAQLWLEQRHRQSGFAERRTELTAAQRVALPHNGQRYLRNVQTLADMCRRHGVKLLLVTFIQDGANHLLHNAKSVEHQNQLLRDFAAAERVELLDLAREFEAEADKASYFFSDHYHPTPRGAEYLAGRVARRVAEMLRK
ncbi:MAG: hypothetical protein KDC87_18120 [Planctomycetes bacterium]|nr:hypothetical protein [Planctomycetota bacterium]MCB9889286.1 hypothetical protein [Planctomycetota bacterium]